MTDLTQDYKDAYAEVMMLRERVACLSIALHGLLNAGIINPTGSTKLTAAIETAKTVIKNRE